jgi:parvulin-like peptidyl-prolyl isomerase
VQFIYETKSTDPYCGRAQETLMKFKRTVVMALSGSLLASCRQGDQQTGFRPEVSQAVATVGAASISPEALRGALERQGPRDFAGASAARERKLAVLETLVRSEAIYAKAKLAGFDQRPEIQAQIKNLVVDRFVERQFKPQQSEPTEAEVTACYKANIARYQQSGAVRGAIMFLKCSSAATAEKRAELRAEAEALLKSAMNADESTFTALVARRSDEQATRYRGGDTGWQTSEDKLYAQQLVEALFALHTPGEFAPVVETEHGFYIAKLLQRRQPGSKPLAEVHDVIRYELSRDKAHQAECDFYTVMKSGLEIRTNLTLIDTISLASARAATPSVPGAQPH